MSLGPGQGQLPQNCCGLPMSEFLTVIEDGVRKYSHLSKQQQFWKIRADLKRARMGRLSRPASMGGTIVSGGTG